MFLIPRYRVFRVKGARYYSTQESSRVFANDIASGLYRIDWFVRELHGDFTSFKYTPVLYPPYEEKSVQPCTDLYRYKLIETDGLLCEMAWAPIYAVQSPRSRLPLGEDLHHGPNSPEPPEIELVPNQNVYTWLLFCPRRAKSVV